MSALRAAVGADGGKVTVNRRTEKSLRDKIKGKIRRGAKEAKEKIGLWIDKESKLFEWKNLLEGYAPDCIGQPYGPDVFKVRTRVTNIVLTMTTIVLTMTTIVLTMTTDLTSSRCGRVLPWTPCLVSSRLVSFCTSRVV